MKCKGDTAERLAESYLQGTLPDPEREQFEDHYFGCEACQSFVLALQAAQTELASRPRVTRPVPVRGGERRWLWSAAAAAMILGCALLALYQVTERLEKSQARLGKPQPAVATAPSSGAPAAGAPLPNAKKAGAGSKQFVELADLRLPVYAPPNVRGATMDTEFATAMQAYRRGDCKSAIPGLAGIADGAPQKRAAQFYGGACQLAGGDLVAATDSLREVVAAGDSPQYEAALYEMAQLMLLHGNAAEARKYLHRAITLHGDFESRARAQLAKLLEAAGRE